MCISCKIIHLYKGFRSSLQYFHEIDKIRSLISLGDMTVESGTFPIDDITGDTKGYLRHELKCLQCGQKFAVWFDCEGSSGLCML